MFYVCLLLPLHVHIYYLFVLSVSECLLLLYSSLLLFSVVSLQYFVSFLRPGGVGCCWLSVCLLFVSPFCVSFLSPLCLLNVLLGLFVYLFCLLLQGWQAEPERVNGVSLQQRQLHALRAFIPQWRTNRLLVSLNAAVPAARCCSLAAFRLLPVSLQTLRTHFAPYNLSKQAELVCLFCLLLLLFIFY